MISNLDLNQDGYVDYLRVVETVEGNTHVFVIEAVLGTFPASSLQSMAFPLVLGSLSCMLQIPYNEILQRISGRSSSGSSRGYSGASRGGSSHRR